LRLTPLDIKKQEFKRTMRGYDPEEVNAFLEMVAEEFEALHREKNRLEDETLKLRTQLHDYQEVERTLKQTLMNAQESMQLTRDNSKREADLVLREAELQAERIISDARKKLGELKNELLVVRAQKDSFARRLRHLLESQLELIGVLELDDLGFGDGDHRDNVSPAKEQPVKPARPVVQETGRNANNNAALPRAVTTTKHTDVTAAAIAPTTGAPRPNTAPANRDAAKERTGNFPDGKKEPKISDHFIT
jgi:cell division initiation protein